MIRNDSQPQGMSFIERIRPTSDETPPWKDLVFKLPVESDKLSEELRRTYPNGSTLRERKHMAAIDFLKAELQCMQSRHSSSAVEENNYLATPGDTSLYSDAADGPTRLGSRSSSLSPSSTTRVPVFVRDNSQQEDMRGSPTSTKPFLTSVSNAVQQFVFSAVDGRTLQPKTKRPMTKKEKVEYKKTRKRGACLPCRRQKAKCTHVIDESAELVRPDRTSRAVKRKFSIELSTDQDRANITIKPEDQQHTSQSNSNAPSYPHHSLSETNKVAHGYSEPVTRVEADQHDSRQDQEMQGDVQNDLSRYVNNHVTDHPYGNVFHGEHSSPWPEFRAATGIEPFSPVYHQLPDLDMPEDSLLLSPSENITSLRFSLQSDFPDYNQGPWTEIQDHRTDHVEPG